MKSHTFASRAIASVAVLVTVALGAAGCTNTITGVASPATNGVRPDAPPSDLTIEGTDGGEIDQLVANSMDDIMIYWEDQAPGVFGEGLPALKGGIHSYDPATATSIPCFEQGEIKYAANNAFYCQTEDAIAYDRVFLGQLVDEFGQFIVPLVMAHEFGHALQFRFGVEANESIALEGQADCYAGVFTKAAVDGTAHFQATTDDLDTVLSGYLLLRDQPGASAEDEMAHGSAFDRVGAFQEGFLDGGEHCYTGFGPDREYTEIPYTANDKQNEGNLPYDETIAQIPPALNAFASEVLGSEWQEAQVQGFDSGSAKCDGDPTSELVFYCEPEDTVHYSETTLAEPAYEKFGDFATMTAIGLGYAEGIQQISGMTDTASKEGLEGRLCLLGAFAGAAFEANVSKEKNPLTGDLLLSAGDLDESVMLLIALGEDDSVISTYGVDAFDRINAFREAVQGGREDAKATAEACL